MAESQKLEGILEKYDRFILEDWVAELVSSKNRVTLFVPEEQRKNYYAGILDLAITGFKKDNLEKFYLAITEMGREQAQRGFELWEVIAVVQTLTEVIFRILGREYENQPKLLVSIVKEFARIIVQVMLAVSLGFLLTKEEVIKRTEELATIDRLTTLYNYGYFREQLEKELQRSKRTGHPVALAMIDIDNFKAYNDTMGHLKGDIALQQVAGLIKKHIREIDIACRYGGEEFAVILPESDRVGGVSVAERVRKKIDESRFDGEERLPNNNLTISIGVADYPYDARNPEQLIQKADAALYEAKKQGGNKSWGFGS